MIWVLARESSPPWIILAALAILALYLLLTIPRRLARRSSILGQPADAGMRMRLRLQEQIDRAELGLLEIRQEFEARSRNEILLLRTLVGEADDRIGEIRLLVRLLARSSAAEIGKWPALLERPDSIENGVPELHLTGKEAETLRRLLGPIDGKP